MMNGTGIGLVAKAVGDRVLGDGPGVGRALLAAAVTGTATAALTYHVLRSGGSED
jgi:hypothetical protein